MNKHPSKTNTGKLHRIYTDEEKAKIRKLLRDRPLPPVPSQSGTTPNDGVQQSSAGSNPPKAPLGPTHAGLGKKKHNGARTHDRADPQNHDHYYGIDHSTLPTWGSVADLFRDMADATRHPFSGPDSSDSDSDDSHSSQQKEWDETEFQRVVTWEEKRALCIFRQDMDGERSYRTRIITSLTKFENAGTRGDAIRYFRSLPRIPHDYVIDKWCSGVSAQCCDIPPLNNDKLAALGAQLKNQAIFEKAQAKNTLRENLTKAHNQNQDRVGAFKAIRNAWQHFADAVTTKTK